MRQRYAECPQCQRETATKTYRPGIDWGIHCGECGLHEYSLEWRHTMPRNWISSGLHLAETPEQARATDAYLAAHDVMYHTAKDAVIPTGDQLDAILDTVSRMIDATVASGDGMEDIACRLRMLAYAIDQGIAAAPTPDEIMAAYQATLDEEAEAARRWVD